MFFRGNLRWTQLLDAQLGQPLAHLDALLQRLALNNASGETTSKGITSAVGVVDQCLVDRMDRELLDLIFALDSDQGRLGSLGHDGNTLSLGVLLGQVGEGLGDFLQVLGLEAVRLGVGSSLGLVSDDIVPVGGAGVERVLEELRDERGGKRQDESLVLGSSLLGKLLDRRGADWNRSVCQIHQTVRLTGRMENDSPVKWYPPM